jgi:hypothetical protein
MYAKRVIVPVEKIGKIEKWSSPEIENQRTLLVLHHGRSGVDQDQVGFLFKHSNTRT